MAKKSEAKTQEEKIQQDSQTLKVPENVMLPKEEESAIQVMANPTTEKSYRLKNPYTQYTDPESGWTLAADQSKPLPENHSAETIERIKKGFLVEDSGESGK